FRSKGIDETKQSSGAKESPGDIPPQSDIPVLLKTPSAPLTAAPDQEEHQRKAMEILEHGNPLTFFLDVFHRDHVGDREVAECLIMSVASQSVENTAGLHVALSGNSGKGKTHACNAMVRLLPEDYRLKGTVSDKALFYHESLKPGTVLLFDDFSLSDDMQELLKSATANFREPIEHRTLTRERQLKLCTIPERCVWWLAKVESIGDDQVMNRMLTVWIDDSKKQDLAVLDHLKKAEAGVFISPAEDTDVPICQAMWGILKGAVRRVKIPFAERICFSVTHNRRNPAMLFDLMKCHALLHYLQRETDTDGAIIATHEDFEYARQLFSIINGDGGGQETKLTRNESVALSSIAKMGLEVFTIQTLQETLGLSYKQIYRLLHGYTNSRATYAGILDKCPAVSLITATVAEELYGLDIRRQKHFFSFDRIMYHTWTAGADVWLKPDDSDDNADDDRHSGDDNDGGSSTLPPAFHPNMTKSGTQDKEHIGDIIGNKGLNRDIYTDSTGEFHHNQVSYSDPVLDAAGWGGVSDTGESGTLTDKRGNCIQIPIQSTESTPKKWKTEWNRVETGGSGGTRKIKSPGTTLPLPTILDHQDFRRSTVSLGHCTLCGNGAAVYHSDNQRASVCEGCYARLVREWNRAEGVG
ncbi:MAG: hypothetical protein WC346_21040, partial [Methanogenium sp.]